MTLRIQCEFFVLKNTLVPCSCPLGTSIILLKKKSDYNSKVRKNKSKQKWPSVEETLEMDFSEHDEFLEKFELDKY